MPNPRDISAAGEKGLIEILRLIGPYAPDITLIGGWVPYLYQRYGDFPEWRTHLSRTTELDVVLPAILKAANRPALSEILNKAGFSSIDGGDGAIWVRERADERIEFFTAHKGTAKQLGRTRTIVGQPDVAGIQLTELSLLTRNTLNLELRAARASIPRLAVRVPTLGAYVLNKSLTFNERMSSANSDARNKAAKDIVYLSDIMQGGERVPLAMLLGVPLITNDRKLRASFPEIAISPKEFLSFTV